MMDIISPMFGKSDKEEKKVETEPTVTKKPSVKRSKKTDQIHLVQVISTVLWKF